MLKKLEENKDSITNTTIMLKIIKQLTVGKLYSMNKVVLGPECLAYVKQMLNTKNNTMNMMLDAHKVSFLNSKTKISKMVKKYF